ncbi:MAG: class I SAM-dependent methyltransferase [Acidimicrobiales bacterium]
MRDHRGVHREVEGFSKRAGEYERGRPDYPTEVVTWIVEQTGLGPGDVVVDLAAGTGKLTRRLVAAGARIVAVEPVTEMRAQLTALLPEVEVEAVDGTAEATGLPDGVAAVVTVAQAFHWFSTPEAIAEIARVLQPAGWLALVWNRRDLSQPIQAEISRVMASHRHEAPSYESGAWSAVMDATPWFEKVAEHRVGFVQVLDAAGLSDRVGSTSFIANLPEAEHAEVLREVRALVTGESVELRYDSTAYLYRRR